MEQTQVPHVRSQQMYCGECPSFSRRSWQTCRLQSLRQRFEKPQTTTINSRVATGNWCDGYDLFNGRWVVAQRGLRSIMKRRYSGRSVEIKEKVHDEVEEKMEWKKAVEGFLCSGRVRVQANLTENMCLVQTMAGACAH